MVCGSWQGDLRVLEGEPVMQDALGVWVRTLEIAQERVHVLVEEAVPGADVSVDDFLCVNVGDGFCELARPPESLRLIDSPTAKDLLNSAVRRFLQSESPRIKAEAPQYPWVHPQDLVDAGFMLDVLLIALAKGILETLTIA